jgi:hypothetical protein
MQITIQNLSPVEIEIADALWACEDLNEVRNYVLRLPKSLRDRAHALYHTMIYEVIDQEMDVNDLEMANQVIDKYR